jgi:hypothetical protein
LFEDDYFPDVDALYEEHVMDHWYNAIDEVLNTYEEDGSDEDLCGF